MAEQPVPEHIKESHDLYLKEINRLLEKTTLEELQEKYENGDGLEAEASCPISMMVITDPVIISSGLIMEKASFLDGQGQPRLRRCPYTNIDVDAECYPIESFH